MTSIDQKDFAEILWDADGIRAEVKKCRSIEMDFQCLHITRHQVSLLWHIPKKNPTLFQCSDLGCKKIPEL